MAALAQSKVDSLVPIVLDTAVATNTDTLFFEANEADVVPAKDSFMPNSDRVVWMGAIIPGYGQILNRKYWKLPIVYGGFLVCAYAITWNGGRYSTYKAAYRDILSENPNATSYLDILPKGITIDDLGGVNAYTSLLKTRQDQFRRYRDLSIFATAAYYGITVLDAYVDAQLFDFDISPDLSMSVRPSIINDKNPWSKQNNSYGMQISFNLK